MNSHDEGKSEPLDPDTTARLLDLELMRQRAARQNAGAPYRGLRAVSLIFLIVIILGTLFALYYVFYAGGLDEIRARKTPNSTPSLDPSAP